MALYAGEKMKVSVCNPGRLPAVVVASAEQASVVFRAIDDPEQGALLFAKKRCGGCHDHPSSGAPDRSASFSFALSN